MTGTSNPVQQIGGLSSGSDLSGVSKADFISWAKVYVRQVVSDTNAILNGDWSGQFAGLHLISDSSDWDIDTSDTTTAADGVNFQRDSNGILFKRVQPVSNTIIKKLVTASGDVTLADNETADIIEINNTSSAAISVFLPSATARIAKISIRDVGGNANTFNITVKPKSGSGQTIMTGSTYIIDSNGGGIDLEPNSAKTGYE